MVKSFPKIFQLGTKYIRDIFDGEVEITEKVDGSQFNFGRTGGALWYKSKNKELYREDPNMFKLAVEFIDSIEPLIPDDTAFHCEYLIKEKHNVLKYDRTPRHNLVCFGASTPDEEYLSDYAALADRLDLESVPVLFYGQIQAWDDMNNFLQLESFLGGTPIEGVVVKNYSKPVFVGDRLLPITCGKFVSEKFKEKHDKDWKNEKGSKNQLMKLMEGYRTKARWEKAVQSLRDAGLLLEDPKDIGALIRQVHEDLLIEETDNIKDELFKLFRRDITNKSTAGLPEWYKEKIAWNSFNPVTGDSGEVQE